MFMFNCQKFKYFIIFMELPKIPIFSLNEVQKSLVHRHHRENKT
jgi:hypothetical protein